MGRNLTGKKSLEALAQHEAVKEICHDEDGYEILLHDNFTFDGSHSIFDYTIAELKASFKRVVKEEISIPAQNEVEEIPAVEVVEEIQETETFDADTLKKISIIESIGFTQYHINFKSLKPTQSNIEITRRVRNSNYYIVFTNETHVTAHTQFIVTTQEIKLLEKLTGKQYIKCSTAIDHAGLWSQWCK